MERELWSILTEHLTYLTTATRRGRFVHPTARILRIYLWAVLHDRPVYWACDIRNWYGVKPPPNMPNQSTMSRRLARPEIHDMLHTLLDRLEPAESQALVMRIDGKALPVSKHSCDSKATIGRGTGGFQKGYKLHAIYAYNDRPIVFRVAPMNVDERTVAKQIIEQTQLGEGYLLGDANYETNPLYKQVNQAGRIYVTPRRFKKAKGVGQTIKHSKHRLAMIDRMQQPSPFIRELLASRRSIETRFANLCNFGGGLTHLPPWIRGDRVLNYVTAKIIIRLTRNKLLERKRRA